MTEKEVPEYRFKYEIVDATNDEVVMEGSTFISAHISEIGECESVDMEISTAFRNFGNKVREEYEAENYSEASEDEDDNN